jgi:hypothetical protein
MLSGAITLFTFGRRVFRVVAMAAIRLGGGVLQSGRKRATAPQESPLPTHGSRKRLPTWRPLSRTSALARTGRNGPEAAVTRFGRYRNGAFRAVGTSEGIFAPA